MSHDNLPPAEKGKVTKLINEGCEIRARQRGDDERLKEIKAELWPYAEQVLEETEENSVTFTSPKGSYTVTKVMSLRLNPQKAEEARQLLGDRFDDLVEVKHTFSLTSGFKRLLSEPQPQEADLSEELAGVVDEAQSTRADFKPAA